MRKMVVFVAVMAMASLAMAELQNIEVGGEVRIRGNWWTNEADMGPVRLQGEPGVDPFGVFAGNIFGWDSEVGDDIKFVEQRTKLNVKADFTDQICAFIELDSYDVWGEDTRTNVWLGADMRAASVNDVEVYQSYIQVDEMWGQPLMLRVGRQEVALGNQWLVGLNDTSSLFTGLSLDGILLNYATDMFSVSGFAGKIQDNSPIEQDSDIDLYGVYGSYLGIEDITIDAYWLMVRDARGRAVRAATGGGLPGELPIPGDFSANPWWPGIGPINNLGLWILNAVEDWTNTDQMDPTVLHTIGLRGAGTYSALDFEAEVAYQFGNADMVTWPQAIRPWQLILPGVAYSDSECDWGKLGANAEVGYTFDMDYAPRVFLGGAYLQGEDNRTPTFWQSVWGALWPWRYQDASLGFNRLASNVRYSEFLDINQDLSNAWVLNGGVSAKPTEDVELMLKVTYLATDDANVVTGPWRMIRRDLSKELGWEVGVYGTYKYSEDLTFKAGYAHLFVGDGLTGENHPRTLGGNFVFQNGLLNGPGAVPSWPLFAFLGSWLPFGPYFWDKEADDADYLFAETQIKF